MKANTIPQHHQQWQRLIVLSLNDSFKFVSERRQRFRFFCSVIIWKEFVVVKNRKYLRMKCGKKLGRNEEGNLWNFKDFWSDRKKKNRIVTVIFDDMFLLPYTLAMSYLRKVGKKQENGKNFIEYKIFYWAKSGIINCNVNWWKKNDSNSDDNNYNCYIKYVILIEEQLFFSPVYRCSS